MEDKTIMESLVLTQSDDIDVKIHFNLKDIDRISYRTAKEIYNVAELEKNGYKPLELLMSISFKNGDHANFSVNNNWTIIFE